MEFKVPDTVILTRDLAEHGLCRGDLGTVVHVYGQEAAEVEFVTAGGRTEALVTLKAEDIRPVKSTDLIAVRPTDPSG